MKFPRQAKIFRGQLLDAAPVAGVAFLLLIFIQLGSLLYTPGVLVQLKNPAATIRIAADGTIQFGANSYTEADANPLREALRNSPAGPPFDLRADSNTPPQVAARASNFVNSIFQIRLPAGPRNLLGTDDPTVLVRVNFLGQYFYENRIVGERELKDALKERRQAAARESKELTLTVAGDEQVNWSAVTRLAQWAGEAGIRQTFLAEWLDKPSASPAGPPP
jgi:biopolymer transport protein ExbD